MRGVSRYALVIAAAIPFGFTLACGQSDRSHAARPKVGEQTLTKNGGYHACPTRELLTEYIDASVRSDAVAKFSVILRGCIRLPEHARVRVEDAPAFTKDVQIRLYGDMDHEDLVLWTTDNALEGH